MSFANAEMDVMETLHGRNLVIGNSEASHGHHPMSMMFNVKQKPNTASLTEKWVSVSNIDTKKLMVLLNLKIISELTSDDSD